MVVEMGRAEFEDLVAVALDDIPDALLGLVDNLVVLVEDDPPAADPDLLGLYEGVDLVTRGDTYGSGGFELPDRVFVFRNPLLAMCADVDELRHEVRVTVVHEIAHHFGIDDARLHELGYA